MKEVIASLFAFELSLPVIKDPLGGGGRTHRASL